MQQNMPPLPTPAAFPPSRAAALVVAWRDKRGLTWRTRRRAARMRHRAALRTLPYCRATYLPRLPTCLLNILPPPLRTARAHAHSAVGISDVVCGTISIPVTHYRILVLLWFVLSVQPRSYKRVYDVVCRCRALPSWCRNYHQHMRPTGGQCRMLPADGRAEAKMMRTGWKRDIPILFSLL